jgi:hypothetical protein
VREAEDFTLKIWEPKSPGNLWVTPGLLRDCFNLLEKKQNEDVIEGTEKKLLA